MQQILHMVPMLRQSTSKYINIVQRLQLTEQFITQVVISQYYNVYLAKQFTPKCEKYLLIEN